MANLKIKLVKSLNGRLEKHIATAESLGLRKIGQVTIQPDNTQTRGKIAQIGYLVKVTEREMTVKQNAEVSKFLHTISDFERISDHALNIAEAAKELLEKNLSFSAAAAHELEVMEAALTEILSTAIRSFVNNDLQLAARVEPLEALLDNLCDEMKLHHVDRLQKGLCTLGQGFVFNDLLTNYERVADHCSNIAVALIELESDSFDTHEYLNSLKELKSDMYERYYEEYRRIYQL